MAKFDNTGIFKTPIPENQNDLIFFYGFARPDFRQAITDYKNLAELIIRQHGFDPRTGDVFDRLDSPPVVYEAQALLNRISELSSVLEWRFLPLLSGSAKPWPETIRLETEAILSYALTIGALSERLKARHHEEDVRLGRKAKENRRRAVENSKAALAKEKQLRYDACRQEYQRLRKAHPHLKENSAYHRTAANLARLGIKVSYKTVQRAIQQQVQEKLDKS